MIHKFTHVALNNGVIMPTVGLGTFQMHGENVKKAVKHALQTGYRLIDSASIYRNEVDIADVLFKFIEESNHQVKREDVFVATKLAPSDLGYQKTKLAFEKSLTNLHTDYIDLYLIHWPGIQGQPASSPENAIARKESWQALEEFYEQKKVRAIGVSNYTIHHLEEMMEYCKVKPSVLQNEFHPYLYDKNLLDYCRKKDIQLEAYSSLGQGLLLQDQKVKSVAKKHHRTESQILLRWALQHEIIVIPKSAQPERIEVEIEEVETEEVKRQKRIDLALADVKQSVAWIEKAVQHNENRYMARALRSLTSLRKKLDPNIVNHFVRKYIIASEDREFMRKFIVADPRFTVIDLDVSSSDLHEKSHVEVVDVYIGLLLMLHLLDSNELVKGMDWATVMVGKIQTLNRRFLDPLTARIYYFYARFFELVDRSAEIRPILLAAQRTATLRHDDETLATLLNLLLRNYLHYNLYDQAEKLISKVTFPENVGNNQLARYFYYLGRIKAIQLDYTDSHKNLMQASIKAPQSATTAGFQQAVHKLTIIVQLLMGEMPDRSIFRLPVLRKSLLPYLHLTQAVRIGDLIKFQETMATHASKFQIDKTYTLILRLRHNVIKAGIRMLNVSYSKISFADICTKLHLESRKDAEFIVAKAIRDSVIDAKIDYNGGYMQSKENIDVYSGSEPQYAFDNRVSFCLRLFNESVKALRFPENMTQKLRKQADEAALRDHQDMTQEIMNSEDGDEF